MRLDRFDLNLLVALQMLLEERSVTAAAQRLNITQSAMSASLKRLRDAFQDELFVLHGRTMVPTPRALTLAPEIARAIIMLRSLIASAAGFDPRTSERRFRIAASDYITTVVIAPLSRHLEREAPSIRLDISLPTDETSQRLAKGEFDLTLTPEEFVDPQHPTELLFEERHVVAGWERNPLLNAPLTIEQFVAAGHVAVQIVGRNTFVENVLAHRGITRRVEVISPSFIQTPWLLPGTNRIALMHERLARLMAPGLLLKIVEVPFDIPPMQEVVQYHSTRARDEGLLWLRTRLRAVAAATA
ncbi:LysR family transcriptional regulator [Glacieibacterium frigidum]|uniref:LysR family transcriptional regulator n=1 Tax=Glacieibacterium frigidum TaxID=2593303 RepID=A0A552UF30_9SPHN|nr:LysR family transcriptional regulator [Glacieibacterium frigidum]TRW16801.1 LysR family transcriptional regulator [Glacieibacterium frigidum]